MHRMMIYRQVLLLGLACVAASFSGCSKAVIDHVAFQISPDQQSISVALVFAGNVQSNLSGTFPIKSYGDVFVLPYSPTQPFELGFQMNVAAANDNSYVHLTPTSDLPNGVPLGLGYPIVQVSPAQPISSTFDLGAYVDVTQQKWFGAEATMSFIDAKNFPAGLALTATFDQDANGNPGILAYAFGPAVDANGNLVKPGGLAVLANIKQLAGLAAAHAGGIVELPPDRQISVSGANADQYRDLPSLLKLQQKLVDGLNSY